MATNTLKNNLLAAIGTSAVDIYTVPAATTTIVLSLLVTNRTIANTNCSISFTSATDSRTANILVNTRMEQGQSIYAIASDAKMVMETGDKITLISNTAASLDAILSFVEQA